MNEPERFESLRRRIARLGADRNPRYFLPHRPLLFLALGLVSRDHRKPPYPLDTILHAYRSLAQAGQQWPPRPLDAVKSMHRSGFLTLQTPAGWVAPRERSLTLSGSAWQVVPPLDLIELLDEGETRPRVLAAGFFPFCEEQREALAGQWDELRTLLERREELEALGDDDEHRPMLPQRRAWASLTAPTAFETLRDLHEQVVERLRGGQVSILGQIPYDEVAYEQAAGLLRRWRPKATTYPGALSLFLVWTGIMHFADNTFWTEVERRTGLPLNDRSDWGQSFERFLAKHGLPSFQDEASWRYVTPILGHGGIPLSCLPDLFEHLVVPALERNVTARQLLAEWRRGDTSYGLHAPVRRFLLHGGRAAADYLEHCLAMARQAFDEGTAVSSAEVLGLPPHVVEAFTEWFQTGKEGTGARSRLRHPFWRLYPGTRLVLHLPAQRFPTSGAALSAQWVVGSHTRSCSVRRLGELAETDAVELPGLDPLADCHAALQCNGEQLASWNLQPLLDADRGWQLFDSVSGKDWHGEALPRSEIWFLGADATFGGDGVRVLQEAPPIIAGEQVWQLTQLDLEAVQGRPWVQTRHGREVLECEPPSPRIGGGKKMDGVDTVDGCSVYRSLPEVHFPDTGDDMAAWTLVVRPIGRSVPSASMACPLAPLVRQEDGNRCLHLEDAIDAPACGRFKISFRVPLGRDHTFRIAWIGDLDAEWSYEGRPQLLVGAASGSVEIEGGGGAADTQVTSASAEQRFIAATYRSDVADDGPVEVPLRFWVPFWRWRLSGVPGVDGSWSREPVRVLDEALLSASEPTLWIETSPDVGRSCLVRVRDADAALQEELFRTGRDGALSISLRRFSDTLRQQHSASCTFEGGHPGEEAMILMRVYREWAPRSFTVRVLGENEAPRILLAWEGGESLPSRALRLQSLWSLEGEGLRWPVPDGVSELEVPAAGLTPGPYRVEFLVEDDWLGEVVRPGTIRFDYRASDWLPLLLCGQSPREQVERIIAVEILPQLADDLGTVKSLSASFVKSTPTDALVECMHRLESASFQPGREACGAVLEKLIELRSSLLRCCLGPCDFAAFEAERTACLEHVRGHHVAELVKTCFRPVEYGEYRQHFAPHLPSEIYRCPHCKYYVGADREYPTSSIMSHVEGAHRGSGFKRIHDLDEIRLNFLREVQVTHACRECGDYFRDKSEVQLVQHAVSDHAGAVFEEAFRKVYGSELPAGSAHNPTGGLA